MKKKAIVLLSGGIDSVTTLYIAKTDYEILALTFDYGQKHKYEIQLAKKHCKTTKSKHLILQLNPKIFKNTALVDQDIQVPINRKLNEQDIPVTYVPARNLLFLSFAVAIAESRGIQEIFIGVNRIDYSGYPDCRPEFIDAFQRTANLATKMGIEGNPFKIHTPLINKKKSEIIKVGTDRKVDYSLTSSCYQPQKNGKPCLVCDSCKIRIQAFKELGLEDPLLKKYNLR
ncbi:MAG: 7-cyano-7-deazaguanine synthase QueC [Leptonema sp. (in: bacteria)]